MQCLLHKIRLRETLAVCNNLRMPNQELIEALEKAVRDAQEELRRARAALAALRGKDSPRGRKKSGPRAGSIPAAAQAALKDAQKPLSAEEIATRIGKGKNARDVSVALARYVSRGDIFAKNTEGKYELLKK